MPSSSLPMQRTLVRSVLIVIWTLICIAIIAAPFKMAHGSSASARWIYLLFASVCHQIPERSFISWGFSWAVCQRCSGIYAGLLVGSLVYLKSFDSLLHSSIRRIVVLAMTLPLLVDVGLQFAGLWASSSLSRFATGAVFGVMLSILLVAGVSEVVREASWRGARINASTVQGDS